MDILSNFSERLKEFMKDEGLNCPRLAIELGVALSTISECKRGAFLPSTRVFYLMLERFHCSADYLLGRTDLPPKRPNFRPVPPFGPRLREVMKLFGVTQYRLEKDLPVSGSVVYHWLNGKSVPSVDSLVRLANFFGCSVDFLIGREI